MRRTPLLVPVFTTVIVFTTPSAAPTQPTTQPTTPGCARPTCHAGIEDIRARDSKMMTKILAWGAKVGDAQGCVICHGGDPLAPNKTLAHKGAPTTLTTQGGPDAYYPDPGSPWVNKRTCGPCHPSQVFAQNNSLMMTEAGKIQGVDWAFGAPNGYLHRWGNYDTKNPNTPTKRLGSETYRRYMQHLKTLEPNVFVDSMEAVPDAPKSSAAVTKDPRLAGLSYLRSECQRCHLGVRGRQTRGDYRGMGCSACHIPYSNEGFYEGGDKSVKQEPGHLLTHQIQSTREVKVTHNGITYSGIPVESCTTCHDRGKRIGVSFQGLMENAFGSPFAADGSKQPKLHSKRYIAMQQDIHYRKGMMCPDCHTSIDVHGDGFLAGSNLGQVQIECTDCHGTPQAFPWELPLGYGEEYAGKNAQKKARGLATTLSPRARQGTVYLREDGYVLTARGNAFSNVVRRGDMVVVHSAGGKDFVIAPLKKRHLDGKLKLDARVAMVSVGRHIAQMECYSCHARWTPQCYGCHVKIDYSKNKKAFDWVAAGRKRLDPAHVTDTRETSYQTNVAGRVHEERSYMRWADPMLVVDGEGRVSPGAPGCQVSVTVIGDKGETILQNHIFRTPKDTEGGAEKGQLSLDMSPVQPHTTDHARPCESCHASAKALGYGIGGGKLNRPWNKDLVVDLATAQQKVLPKRTRTQIAAVKGLQDDWSRIVDEKGQQKMTVGHHFQLSGPLSDAQRQRTDRRGHHVAKATGQLPETTQEHHDLVHKVVLFAGWAQVLGALGALGMGVFALVYILRRRRRRRNMEE
ncbi:MAG: cytochrome C [Deltaproteobacteria bacterium]|nr:cytochrome C [Deltaproteobacteria bacterium]